MNANRPNNAARRHFLSLGTLVGILGLAARTASAAQSLAVLAGHVPPQVRQAVKLERAPSGESMQLSLVVHLDQSLLDETLDQLYGRGSSAQKHFLSSSEFAQKFGVADKRAILKDFAQANGLTLDSADDPNSMVVKVSASAGQIEKAFNVQLAHYRGSDGKIFTAHETEPMIPSDLAPHLGAVLGLSTVTGLLHPHIRKPAGGLQLVPQSKMASMAVAGRAAFSGSGPNSSLVPSDIKSIYGLSSVALSGAGQCVAIFELDGYAPADVTNYQTTFGLPSTPVTFVGVDGTTNLCGGVSCSVQNVNADDGMVEVALDIDMVLAVAPGLSQVIIYDGPNNGQGILDTYNAIATANACRTVSTSWGAPELQWTALFLNTESQTFQRLAIQGQSIYAASADKGAFDDGTTLSVDDPASQPYVTGVGGTSLNGTLASFTETAWDGSGGGVSAVWMVPNYQVGVISNLNSHRNVPDVALNADPASGYIVAVAGGFAVGSPSGGVGGTSAAAPLWAGLTALIDQQRALGGNNSFGFPNAPLYDLAQSTSSAVVFKDITSGNNGFYNAVVGYDEVTGWGSYKGAGMITGASNAQVLVFNDLSNVYAFPNPWDARKHSAKRHITFANLTDGATVKIFTLSGFWVRTLPASSTGTALWDLTNDAGNSVASGLYFYLASNGTNGTKGTIAIIK